MIKPRIGVVLLMVAILLTGCAWFESREDLTAPELASEGMDAYEFGNYKTAIEHFEKLKDWYPFSKFAILAELKIADAHYRLKEYEEAISAYESFENLHPRNEAIPYVIYQIGRCHFDRLDTVDRDQTFARKSLEVFGRLIERFPRDPYARAAAAHRLDCLKSLAGHEFYVGRYYYDTKRYKAALERFKGVLSEYPDVGVHYPTLQYLSRCEAEIQAAGEAPDKKNPESDK
jgi:outer membrane protein assembly factor BamD